MAGNIKTGNNTGRNTDNARMGKIKKSKVIYTENSPSEAVKAKQAVALTYEPGTEAPVIVAAGKGLIAEKIIETAKDNDVPLYSDGKLADTLSRLEIGDTIPPELYKAVADILIFVDSMDKIRGKIWQDT